MRCFFCSTLLVAAAFTTLAGCAKQYPANFKVDSQPEGAHVIFQQGNNPWIYLGVTPLNSLEMIDEEVLESKDKISLKTMRCGYMDQVREWNNEQLKDELEDKGKIFWTPRLIKNIE